MELGPLLYKNLYKFAKHCIMCVLFIYVLLYMLENIIVYCSITGVVTQTFNMQFTILWNMELGPLLHTHTIAEIQFLFVLFV